MDNKGEGEKLIFVAFYNKCIMVLQKNEEATASSCLSVAMALGLSKCIYVWGIDIYQLNLCVYSAITDIKSTVNANNKSCTTDLVVLSISNLAISFIRPTFNCKCCCAGCFHLFTNIA